MEQHYYFSIIGILYIQSWTVSAVFPGLHVNVCVGVCFTVLQKTKQKKHLKECTNVQLLPYWFHILVKSHFTCFLRTKKTYLWATYWSSAAELCRETFSGVTSINLRCLSNNEQKHIHTPTVINKLCTSSMSVLALTHNFLLSILIMYDLMYRVCKTHKIKNKLYHGIRAKNHSKQSDWSKSGQHSPELYYLIHFNFNNVLPHTTVNKLYSSSCIVVV